MTSPVEALRKEGVLIGLCSWTGRTLVEAGTFYPAERMSAEERLRFYAAEFPIVEVDSTYYAPPSEKVAGAWVERTPRDFTFDIKAFRLLTQHPTPPRSLWKDLREGLPNEVTDKKNLYGRDLPAGALGEAFERFNSALMPLHSAGKLGTVLFQFPPYFYPSPVSRRYLDEVAQRVPEYDVAVEFRQERWMDEDHRERSLALLSELGLNYVSVDGPQGFRSSMPAVAASTGSVAEVRFHGRNADTWEARGITAEERFQYDYSREELSEWVPRIRALQEDGGPVHVLMNNCYADYGVRSARLMADLLAESV
ncbi:MAG: DUF72 domain-containing protein [Acidimicrobiia bacterium]